jgi:putative phosphoribosyl transferase
MLAVMRLPFADRAEAGRDLAEHLRTLGLERPIVYGVPRGGVAVAAHVARALDGDLDVIVVRKIGAPDNPELGLGAVGPDGPPALDDRIVSMLDVRADFLEREIEAQRAEARRRVAADRVDTPEPDITGRDAVVVDDGIATGGTVIAAGRLLRARGPRRLVLAVPVAPMEAISKVAAAFDEVVCPHTPLPYVAVGQWYVDFHQVTDDEVRALIAAHGPGKPLV